jgi:aspartyl-tRNA(Asn)/glutamyl-tRNA(Gln) amidotransferase subunit C
MKITIDDVSYISKLAKLRFTEEEAAQMAREFQNILTHFESIDKYDLSDIELNVFSKDMKPVYRKDEASVFEDKGKLFQNVKTMSDTSIKVPKIIE